MTLESLESTLQRIAEIQSRMDRFDASQTQPATDGADFQAALASASGNLAGSTAPVPGNIDALIQEQAQTQGLDANLLKAVIKNESNFNPKAVSPVGAQGLMQLMPGTAAGLGVTNSFDPSQNIQGGAKYLKGLLQKYDQSLPKALAAYNAGPGAVDKHHGVPPYKETTRYVQKVIQSYQAYQHAEGG